jgi:hypothetical protein
MKRHSMEEEAKETGNKGDGRQEEREYSES